MCLVTLGEGQCLGVIPLFTVEPPLDEAEDDGMIQKFISNAGWCTVNFRQCTLDVSVSAGNGDEDYLSRYSSHPAHVAGLEEDLMQEVCG